MYAYLIILLRLYVLIIAHYPDSELIKLAFGHYENAPSDLAAAFIVINLAILLYRANVTVPFTAVMKMHFSHKPNVIMVCSNLLSCVVPVFTQKPEIKWKSRWILHYKCVFLNDRRAPYHYYRMGID